ncbi:hypothetical protein [Streptomyces sp. NPDC015345]|uniref:hypothetical protein n=1 Tax=Streptomyces sp. NPDC015345 TaxID=3364953 RepID=UPI00370317E7
MDQGLAAVLAAGVAATVTLGGAMITTSADPATAPRSGRAPAGGFKPTALVFP